MDKKVARIVWNTNGWKRPSGSEGKAGGGTYEGTSGFGHDEWLLDDSRIIDGYHYAFIDPVRKGAHAGKTYEIHFFTRNAAAKEKYYLGYISSVYCLTYEEAIRAYEQYEQRGWIKAMREEIRVMGGNAENFGLLSEDQTPINILNIRFRMEDVHFFKDPPLIADSDPNTKAEYYRLYDYKSEFELKLSNSERDNLATLFEKYICSCVTDSKTNKLLEPAAAKQIVNNLNPDFIFDVVPQMQGNIESFYAISDPEVIIDLIDSLRKNKEFIKNDTKHFRQTALSHYATFLRVLKFLQGAQGTVAYSTKREFRTFTDSISHYQKFLTALRAKPFLLLAGISGTGKSRIVREMAYKSCPTYLRDKAGTTPGNYCMIEVKPNWHDSSELLGYYSNISKQYQFTRFVKFLVKAMMFPEVPFFVCLDEMNLAPVEQYFAEFLSVLETRRLVGTRIESGVLVAGHFFKECGLTGCRNNGEVYMKLHACESANVDKATAQSASLIEKGLTLPDNVFIIGTVNMDDTTHQFSRKVIDRAMTIEMNGGELEKMFGRASDLQYSEHPWSMSKELRNHYVTADEVLRAYPALADEIKQQTVAHLEQINAVLKGTPFQVSYRVLNELVIYLGVLLDDAGDVSIDELPQYVRMAMDDILLMKVLPRVEGDEDTFDLTDENRQSIIESKITNKIEWLLAICRELSLTASSVKIEEMLERLQSGFTRFWP